MCGWALQGEEPVAAFAGLGVILNPFERRTSSGHGRFGNPNVEVSIYLPDEPLPGKLASFLPKNSIGNILKMELKEDVGVVLS